MKNFLFVLLFLNSIGVMAQKQTQTLPNEIEIGRLSFIDVGPPFDYYDVERIRRDGDGVLVEKVSMTADTGYCYLPAHVEVYQARLEMKYEDLLGGVNPCDLKAKDAKKEAKRKPHTLTFAGEHSKLQFLCGNEVRMLDVNVQESDIFDTRWKTPTITAWYMSLVGKLDKVTGSSMWDKPIFDLGGAENKKIGDAPEILKEVSEGKYDELFKGGQDLPSVMYRDAQKAIAQPAISLASSVPVMPEIGNLPVYPPIAKAASVEGKVEVAFKVGDDCKPIESHIIGGPKMLEQVSLDAIKNWKYCSMAKGELVKVVFEFKLNCRNTVKTNVW